jgi:hypothetical protein
MDDVVRNAIERLTQEMRDLPWLDPVCAQFIPPLSPDTRSASVLDFTCPHIGSGDDWALAMRLNGAIFDPSASAEGSVLHGRVFIKHNVSNCTKPCIPVTLQNTVIGENSVL